MKPLLYGRAYWVAPRISSHNNYVDLFAHGGILGLLLFFWFAWEVARLGSVCENATQAISLRVTSTACWQSAPAPWCSW